MKSLPLSQVILGDCIQVLESFPEESIDLIFADPPYNLQLQRELWRPNQTKVDAVEDDWDQFESFSAYDDFTRSWLRACRRVLKKTGTIWVIGSYHNIYRVGAILQDLGFWILNDVIWVKTNPMPNFRGVRFTNAHESIIWAQKERGASYTFNHQAMKALNEDKQMRSDWYLPICVGKERIKIDGVKAHSTQKPEALLYRVILASSNPGDVILDPFFGTGTTGVIAKRLHRQWIGIEREERYTALASERIAETEAIDFDSELFVTPEPRRQTRIPFGTLIENGMLMPGQDLYFKNQDDVKARVLADGSLEYNGRRGSIHQIARHLNNGPCNGWKIWYYLDEDADKRRPIDDLREKLRTETDQEE